MLIDQFGRRTGFDPSTLEVLQEIPGTSYSGPGTEPQAITATGVDGDLLIRVVGVDVANYTLEVVQLDAAGPRSDFATRQTAPGQVDDFLLEEHHVNGPSLQLAITIDIKPGGVPNSINSTSKGKIPLAILSSASLDAPARVDRNSLTFGATGNERSLAFCNPNGEDVNGDGLPDLVCHFDTQLTDFQKGDAEGVVKGQTLDGTFLRGTDSVRIVK